MTTIAAGRDRPNRFPVVSRHAPWAIAVVALGAFYMPAIGIRDTTSVFILLLLWTLHFKRGFLLPTRRVLTVFKILLGCSLVFPLLNFLILNGGVENLSIGGFHYQARIGRSLLLFLLYVKLFSMMKRGEGDDRFAQHFLFVAIPHLVFVLLQFSDLFGTGVFFRELNTYVGSYTYAKARNYGLMSGVDTSGVAVALACIMQRYRMSTILGVSVYIALVAMLLITSRTGIVMWLATMICLGAIRVDFRWKVLLDAFILSFALGTVLFIPEIRTIDWLANPLEPIIQYIEYDRVGTVSTDDLFNLLEFHVPPTSFIGGELVDPRKEDPSIISGYISDSGYVQIITAIGIVGLCLTLILLFSIIKDAPRTRLRGYMIAIAIGIMLIGVRGPIFFGRFVFDILFMYAAWYSVQYYHSAKPQFDNVRTHP